MTIFYPTMTALACLSPTLTLLALWQLKEWRWDRLREHLRREGLTAQLFGRLRPAILGIWIVGLSIASIGRDPVYVMKISASSLLFFLGILSCLQIAAKKQPIPVRTMKALFLSIASMVMPVGVAMVISMQHPVIGPMFIALIPFGCPLWVTIAWAGLTPVDRFLKTRMLNRARELRRLHSKLTVIGITGSVGKTTTKELLAHILRERGALATPAHVNTEMGVAKWLTEALKGKPADWPGILIVEMGAYHEGEIRLLCSVAQPNYGIVTSIGHQHLSLFGSPEAIAETKGELVEGISPDGRAFLNRDNEASRPLEKLARCPVTTVDTGGHADVSALDIEERPGGIRFTVSGTEFQVPVAGTHLVTCILLAIAAARELGMDLPSIAKALRTFKPLPQMFEVRESNGITVLDDTYNASPDSFRAAIEWARSQPHGEKVLLTEGIIELGSYEADIHEKLAREASEVFARASIGSPHFLPYFRNHGFGDRAALVSSDTERVKPGGLLVCIGRMPRSTIDQLLPQSS